MSETFAEYMASHREQLAAFFAEADQCLMILRDAILDEGRLTAGFLGMVTCDSEEFFSELDELNCEERIGSIEMLLVVARVGLAYILETARDGHSPGPG